MRAIIKCLEIFSNQFFNRHDEKLRYVKFHLNYIKNKGKEYSNILTP